MLDLFKLKKNQFVRIALFLDQELQIKVNIETKEF